MPHNRWDVVSHPAGQVDGDGAKRQVDRDGAKDKWMGMTQRQVDGDGTERQVDEDSIEGHCFIPSH